MEWTILTNESTNQKIVVEFENGQKFKLSREEVKRAEKTVRRTNPNFSEKYILLNAIEMVLEDEGILENVEQKELIEKTKGQRHQEQGEKQKKPRKAPTRKPNEVKNQIRKWFIEKLITEGIEISEEKEGEFQFDLNEKHFTIKIVERRPKKEA